MTPEGIITSILSALISALPKLMELFSHASGRDAFLAAIDGSLAVARAKTDEDLKRKHQGDV
jgi:hypothetical protein